MRTSALALTAVGLLLATATAAGAPRQPDEPTQGGETRVSLSGIREHLRAFQAIADRNGGNRAAGTRGYDASAAYVARRLRAAGYRVQLQRFSFQFVADRRPPTLRRTDGAGAAFRPNRDHATLAYSGSGRVEAPVVAVDLRVPVPAANASTSGCEAADFAGFPRGAVALVQRGTCPFREKVELAIRAGAAAVVVFNDGAPGREGLFAGTLGPPQVRVPALAASFGVGDALRNGGRTGPTGATVRITADTVAERRRTANVLAESRVGDPANAVTAGAHLDSVDRGPGINDNGSGSAVLLEIAEELARARPRNRLRFAWWSAEEIGLVGSRHYVSRLSAPARRRIALYLNFDMVGSRNGVFFVYDGDGSAGRTQVPLPPGSAAIERAFARAFTARGLPFSQTNIGASSDHASFARAGIPVGGLFTGAEGRKSAGEAASFGGPAGQPYDPCYHRRCDTIANVSGATLLRIAQVAADTIARFARDVSAVRTRR